MGLGFTNIKISVERKQMHMVPYWLKSSFQTDLEIGQAEYSRRSITYLKVPKTPNKNNMGKEESGKEWLAIQPELYSKI